MGNSLVATFFGILVGLIPVVNLIVATVMAFNRKHKRRILLLVALVVTFAASIANSDSDTHTETTPMASELALQVNLAIANTNAGAKVDTLQLDSLVKTAWPKIAANHGKNKKLQKMLQHAVNHDFSSESHDKLVPYLNSLHRLAAQKDSSVQTAVLKETEDFVWHYMYKEREERLWPIFIVLATYIMGLYYCIVLFKTRATENTSYTTPGNQQQAFSQPAAANNRRQTNPRQPGRRPMPGDDLSLFDTRNQGTETENISGEDFLNQLENNNDIISTTAASTGDPIYINFLNEAQLARIPGISSIQAKTIIQQRNSGGPFINRDDFAARSRLSEMVIERMEDQLNYSVSGNNNGGNSGGRVLDI